MKIRKSLTYVPFESLGHPARSSRQLVFQRLPPNPARKLRSRKVSKLYQSIIQKTCRLSPCEKEPVFSHGESLSGLLDYRPI